MKQGLVIGKFMPLHAGHIALINFSAEQCDNLIVHCGALPGDPIPGPERLGWLWQTFRNDGRVFISYGDEDLPDSSESCREVSRIWAAYLVRRYPSVHVLFSSEPYGEYLAEYMDIEHVPFDPGRGRVPVSGTQIREAPFAYWNFVPEAVRPYYRKKVCIYGPESTGKTRLTESLARYYETAFVPEMAREVLAGRTVEELVYEDIPVIARCHAVEILEQEKYADRLLFCDTDLLTTQIYSAHYFQKVPEFPTWVEIANSFDLYLFCDDDLPWVKDPHRNSGHLREYFREWFMRELDERGIEFKLVNGSGEDRFVCARDIVESKWRFR